MQQMVLDAKVRPTLVARPDEIFERPGAAVNGSTPGAADLTSPGSAHVAETTRPTHVFEERFSNAVGNENKRGGAVRRPWNAAEALLQLKLALEDADQLQSASIDTCPSPAANSKDTKTLNGGSSSTPVAHAPSAAAVSASVSPAVYLPPMVRCCSTAPTSSSPSAYAQQSLRHLRNACNQLEKQMGPLTAHENTQTSSAASSAAAEGEELQWAVVMHCLQEPALVMQLQRRAGVVVWEKECSYRLHDLLAAELRRRRVPLEMARQGVSAFMDQLHRSRKALDTYPYVQRTMDVLAPMVEAGAARTECLRSIARESSPAVAAELEHMEHWVSSLTAQVAEDTKLLGKNVAALQKRFEACQSVSTATAK